MKTKNGSRHGQASWLGAVTLCAAMTMPRIGWAQATAPSAAECALARQQYPQSEAVVRQMEANYRATHTDDPSSDPNIRRARQALREYEQILATQCSSGSDGEGAKGRKESSVTEADPLQQHSRGLLATLGKESTLGSNVRERPWWEEGGDERKEGNGQASSHRKGVEKVNGGSEEREDPKPDGDAPTLNPEADHSGTSCRYFTCNAVRKDGAGTNFHSNGAFVIYGESAYECRSGHWFRKGPATAWLPQAKHLRAEVLEAGCIN